MHPSPKLKNKNLMLNAERASADILKIVHVSDFFLPWIFELPPFDDRTARGTNVELAS